MDRTLLDTLDGVLISGYDLIIPEKHFGKCPFDRLTGSNFGEVWSISRGGGPVPDHIWTINIFQRDANGEVFEMVNQDKWVMPEVFTRLFRHFEKTGDENRLKGIREALNL